MKSVAIVGGGVIGLSTALYAAQRGHTVRVFDRHDENHAGCSHGNAGMIVPSHFVPMAAPGAVALALKWMGNPESPFWIKPRLDLELLSWGWRFFRSASAAHVARSAPLLRDLHLASRACFEELADTTGNSFGLQKRGLLMLCQTEHALSDEAHAAEQAVRLGVPAEVLDSRQTAALDPSIQMDIAGAVYFPKDCHLDPGEFMKALRDLAQKAGVQFSHVTDVTSIESNGSAVLALQTSRGRVTADEYVLCGGSWSPLIARGLGLKLPIQPGKGYSLTLKNPRQLPRICAILCEARVAVTPMGNSLRVGGTMEMAGLTEEINPARVQGIIKSMLKYYPEFKIEYFAGIEPWSGLRPCSPDGMPYLGRTAKYTNLSIATGHAMMGLSLGPATGKLMAEILSGEKPSIDINLLNPDRYA